MKKFFLALILALTHAANGANTITVIATKTPEEAEKLPMQTEKIEMSSPVNAGASTLNDVVKNTAGLQVTGGALKNAGQLSLRGYGGNNIILLLDGTRQSFAPQHGSNIFLDPSMLKQVEVLYGSSSAIYGSGGLGGVVAFETKEATDMLKPGQTAGFMQQVGYLSASHESSSITTAYAAGEKADAIANVALRKDGTLKLSNGDNFAESGGIIKSFLLKTNYQIDDESKLRLGFQSYRNDSKEYADPQSYAGGGSTSGMNLVDKEAESYTAKIEYNRADFLARTYYVKTEIDYTNLQATTSLPLGGYRMQNLSTWGVDGQNTSTFSIHRLTYGLNYYRNSQNSNNQGEVWHLVPQGSDENIGVFVQDEIRTGQFLIIPALRFDGYKSSAEGHDEITDNALSPRLAASWLPREWLTVFGSASGAFRAPTITEKFTEGQHFAIAGRPPFVYVNTFVANPELKPERNLTYELGLGLQHEGFKFRGSYYRTKARDYINQVVQQGSMTSCLGFGINCNKDTTYYENVAHATLAGFDLKGEYKTGKLGLHLSYSYVNGKDDETGEYLGSLLPRTFKIGTTYDFYEGWQGGVSARLASAFTTVKSGGIAVPGYAVADAFLGYEFRDTYAVTFAINNIFDKEYRQPNTAVFELKRDFRITASYKH